MPPRRKPYIPSKAQNPLQSTPKSPENLLQTPQNVPKSPNVDGFGGEEECLCVPKYIQSHPSILSSTGLCPFNPKYIDLTLPPALSSPQTIHPSWVRQIAREFLQSAAQRNDQTATILTNKSLDIIPGSSVVDHFWSDLLRIHRKFAVSSFSDIIRVGTATLVEEHSRFGQGQTGMVNGKFRDRKNVYIHPHLRPPTLKKTNDLLDWVAGLGVRNTLNLKKKKLDDLQRSVIECTAFHYYDPLTSLSEFDQDVAYPDGSQGFAYCDAETRLEQLPGLDKHRYRVPHAGKKRPPPFESGDSHSLGHLTADQLDQVVHDYMKDRPPGAPLNPHVAAATRATELANGSNSESIMQRIQAQLVASGMTEIGQATIPIGTDAISVAAMKSVARVMAGKGVADFIPVPDVTTVKASANEPPPPSQTSNPSTPPSIATKSKAKGKAKGKGVHSRESSYRRGGRHKEEPLSPSHSPGSGYLGPPSQSPSHSPFGAFESPFQTSHGHPSPSPSPESQQPQNYLDQMRTDVYPGNDNYCLDSNARPVFEPLANPTTQQQIWIANLTRSKKVRDYKGYIGHRLVAERSRKAELDAAAESLEVCMAGPLAEKTGSATDYIPTAPPGYDARDWADQVDLGSAEMERIKCFSMRMQMDHMENMIQSLVTVPPPADAPFIRVTYNLLNNETLSVPTSLPWATCLNFDDFVDMTRASTEAAQTLAEEAKAASQHHQNTSKTLPKYAKHFTNRRGGGKRGSMGGKKRGVNTPSPSPTPSSEPLTPVSECLPEAVKDHNILSQVYASMQLRDALTTNTLRVSQYTTDPREVLVNPSIGDPLGWTGRLRTDAMPPGDTLSVSLVTRQMISLDKQLLRDGVAAYLDSAVLDTYEDVCEGYASDDPNSAFGARHKLTSSTVVDFPMHNMAPAAPVPTNIKSKVFGTGPMKGLRAYPLQTLTLESGVWEPLVVKRASSLPTGSSSMPLSGTVLFTHMYYLVILNAMLHDQIPPECRQEYRIFLQRYSGVNFAEPVVCHCCLLPTCITRHPIAMPGSFYMDSLQLPRPDRLSAFLGKRPYDTRIREPYHIPLISLSTFKNSVQSMHQDPRLLVRDDGDEVVWRIGHQSIQRLVEEGHKRVLTSLNHLIYAVHNHNTLTITFLEHHICKTIDTANAGYKKTMKTTQMRHGYVQHNEGLIFSSDIHPKEFMSQSKMYIQSLVVPHYILEQLYFYLGLYSIAFNVDCFNSLVRVMTLDQSPHLAAFLRLLEDILILIDVVCFPVWFGVQHERNLPQGLKVAALENSGCTYYSLNRAYMWLISDEDLELMTERRSYKVLAHSHIALALNPSLYANGGLTPAGGQRNRGLTGTSNQSEWVARNLDYNMEQRKRALLLTDPAACHIPLNDYGEAAAAVYDPRLVINVFTVDPKLSPFQRTGYETQHTFGQRQDVAYMEGTGSAAWGLKRWLLQKNAWGLQESSIDKCFDQLNPGSDAFKQRLASTADMHENTMPSTQEFEIEMAYTCLAPMMCGVCIKPLDLCDCGMMFCGKMTANPIPSAELPSPLPSDYPTQFAEASVSTYDENTIASLAFYQKTYKKTDIRFPDPPPETKRKSMPNVPFHLTKVGREKIHRDPELRRTLPPIDKFYIYPIRPAVRPYVTLFQWTPHPDGLGRSKHADAHPLGWYFKTADKRSSDKTITRSSRHLLLQAVTSSAKEDIARVYGCEVAEPTHEVKLARGGRTIKIDKVQLPFHPPGLNIRRYYNSYLANYLFMYRHLTPYDQLNSILISHIGSARYGYKAHDPSKFQEVEVWRTCLQYLSTNTWLWGQGANSLIKEDPPLRSLRDNLWWYFNIKTDH